jgi:hypothetical protein
MLAECSQIANANANADSVHAVVAAAAGVATGVYPRDAHGELLAEWPE